MAMQPHVEDLVAVQPADVVSYLARAGWREAGTFGRAVVWIRAAVEDDFEVLVPDSTQLRDYPVRIAELIETVAQVEGRDEAAVLNDLQSPMVDVQHVRTQPEGPSGTIPIRDGLKAVSGVHDLLLSVATTAPHGARAVVLPSQKPTYAWAFLDTVRLGPTSRGSYILRVETPIALSESAADSTPPRDVVTHLRDALQNARSAAVQSARQRSLDVFTDYVSGGVSANLCEALTDIGGQQRNPFDVSFSWALRAPIADDGPSSVEFDSNVIGQIRQAGKHLRNLPIAESGTFTGRVIDLHQDTPTSLGRAVLQGTLVVDGETATDQKVIVHLPARVYQIAVTAHQNSRRITVTGQVRKPGRNPEITTISRIDYAD